MKKVNYFNLFLVFIVSFVNNSGYCQAEEKLKYDAEIYPTVNYGHSTNKYERPTAVCEDGKYFASFGINVVYIWDWSTQKKIKTLYCEITRLDHLRFIKNSSYLLGSLKSRSYPKRDENFLWDIDSGDLIKKFNVYDISLNERYLAFVNQEKNIVVWDLILKEAIQIIKTSERDINCLSFSPDRQLLISGSGTDAIILWDINSGAKIRSYSVQPLNKTRPSFEICSIAFNSIGNKIIASSTHEIFIWNIKDKQVKKYFDLMNNNRSYDDEVIDYVSFFPQSNNFYSIGINDYTVRLWRIEDSIYYKSINLPQYYYGSTFTIDKINNEMIIEEKPKYGSSKGKLSVYRFSLSKQKHIIKYIFKDSKFPLSLCYGGKYFTQFKENEIIVRETRTGQVVKSFTQYKRAEWYSSAIPNKNQLIVISSDSSEENKTFQDGQISLIQTNLKTSNMVSLKLSEKIDLHPYYGYSTENEYGTFSNNGKYYVYRIYDRDSFYGGGRVLINEFYIPVYTNYIYDLATRKIIHRVKQKFDEFLYNKIEISPDGQKLLEISDSSFRIIDTKNGIILKQFSKGNIASFSVNDQWNHFAVASSDNILRIYDLDKLTLLDSIKTDGIVTHSCFDRNEKLFLAYEDGKLEIYSTPNLVLEQSHITGNNISNICCGPDNQYLALLNDANELNIFETKSLKKISSIPSYQYSHFSFIGKSNLILNQNRIWDAVSGKFLAKLYFFHKLPGEYVIIANDGRFDGTESALNLVHFVHNMKIIPNDILFEDLFTPNLLSHLISNKKSTPKTFITKPAESKIIFRTSDQYMKYTYFDSIGKLISKKKELELSIEINQGEALVNSIKIFQNDSLIESDEFMDVSSIRTNKVKVELLSGQNRFRIAVTDQKGYVLNTNEIVLFYSGEKPTSSLHLFCVGVSDYQNSNLKLNYATIDSDSVMNTIKNLSTRLFSESFTYSLKDSQATRSNILENFTEIKRNAKEDDVLVFYFAGHGRLFHANNQDKFGLLPYDFKESNKDKAAITIQEISSLLDKVKAKKQLVVIDACQSGGAVKFYGSRGQLELEALKHLSNNSGFSLLASCRANQEARESKYLNHGIFTYSFLNALRGGADSLYGDGNQITTVKEIDIYLQKMVPKLSESVLKRQQYPQSYNVGEDFPLTILK